MQKQINDIPYLNILKNSLNITWRNRYLWWFGLFLTLGGGMSGQFNFPGSNTNNQGVTQQQVNNFMSQHWGAVVAGIIIAIIIAAILIVLGIIARGEVILALNGLSKGKKTSFRSGMRQGRKYFWRLFWLYVILGILVAVSAIVLATPVVFLLAAKAIVLGIFLAVIACLIFIPIIVLAIYAKTYGEIYIVLGQLKSWLAIENSYELLRKNLWTSIIMGLLFIPVGIILMLGLLAILFFLAIIFLPIGFLAYFVLGWIAAAIVAGIGIFIFLIILFIIQSGFQIFRQSAWLSFFMEIAVTKKEQTAEELEEEKAEALPSTSPIKTAQEE